MLPPQPIATEADTGINAFNLGQPFFAERLSLSRNWQNKIIMALDFLECSTYVVGHLSMMSWQLAHSYKHIMSDEYTLESSLSSTENIDVQFVNF